MRSLASVSATTGREMRAATQVAGERRERHGERGRERARPAAALTSASLPDAGASESCT